MLLLVPSTWQACKPCLLGLAGNSPARGHGQGAKQTHPGAPHSNCNCAAAEAGTEELLGQLWGRTMARCGSCADNWSPGRGGGGSRRKAGGDFYLLHAWQGPLLTSSI